MPQYKRCVECERKLHVQYFEQVIPGKISPDGLQDRCLDCAEGSPPLARAPYVPCKDRRGAQTIVRTRRHFTVEGDV